MPWGELAGNAVESVRKLGVDYASSLKGRGLSAVGREKFRSGLRRCKRLQRLGCVKVGARVVPSGIVPHCWLRIGPVCTYVGGQPDARSNG